MADTTLEVPKDLSTDEEKQAVKSTLPVDAFHNFLQGKRHMLVKDYSHAVQSLADACELYVEHYGALALECGEVYFLYGKALFSLFQQQAGIFGDAVNEEGSDEDEKDSGGSEEEKEGDEEDKNDENEESNDGKEDDSESVSSSKDGEKMDTGKNESPVENDADDNVPTSTAAVETPPVEAGTSSEQKDNEVEANKSSEIEAEAGPSSSKEKTEEEISDLQLAWENLEIAKSIFERQGDQKDMQLKVAEILLLLGEISLECDNYEAAIRDLKEGLAIWQRHLSSDDRRIAETFYQLGLAHQLSNQADRALDYFQHTIDVIQLRINILKNQKVIEKNEDGFEIDPKIEIADLEALLPDIKSKMEDTKDLDKDTKIAMQELVVQKMEEANVTSTSEEKPVMNINHLLKRKQPSTSDTSTAVA